MAVRVILAALLSAALMFFWGFVFWGPVLNMTTKLMSPLPAEAELDAVAPLRATNVPDGMYVYPGPVADLSDEAATEAWNKKIIDGPVFRLAYKQQGFSPTDPTMYVAGLAHCFVIALLSASLLAMVLPSAPSYGRRVGILFLVGVIAATWTGVGDVIWWFHTPQYAAGQIVYTVVGGLLMALATAAIVRPAALAAAPAGR